MIELNEERVKEKKELKDKATMYKIALKETQKKLKELFLNAFKPLVKEVDIKDQIIKN